MRENRVKSLLASGDVACGAGLTIMSPALVELIGLAGFDFVILDEQHGWMNPESVADMIRASENAGLTPMVRVPEIHSPTVGKFLDLGAQGIVFPNVNNDADARRAIASVRYEPLGTRGSCPTVRAADYSITDWLQHYQASNREIFTLLLIESRAGFDNLESILEVEGIDSVLLGPFDLSSSLGVPGQLDHPEVVRRLQLAQDLLRRSEITICSWSLEFDSVIRAAEQGARMFWLSGTKIIADALRQKAATVRRAAGSMAAAHRIGRPDGSLDS